MKADPMAETPTTRCVECGKPTPDGVSYCGKSCRREANRQPAPLPPPRCAECGKTAPTGALTGAPGRGKG